MKADLYAAGFTSLDGLRGAIDHATEGANYAPRLIPSRRYRRWRVIAARSVLLAVAGLAVYLRSRV